MNLPWPGGPRPPTPRPPPPAGRSAGSGPARPPAATFFSRDPQAPQRPVDRRGAARHAGGLARLRQGGVAVGPDRVAEPRGGRGVEGRRPPAAARPGGDRPGLAAAPQEVADPADADGEAGGDLLAGGTALVAGGDHPLPEVDRIRLHPPYPSLDRRNNRVKRQSQKKTALDLRREAGNNPLRGLRTGISGSGRGPPDGRPPKSDDEIAVS